MPDGVSASVVIFGFTLFWFVVYWIVGGVVFSIISVTRFLHVHKTRFSCLFTLLSAGAAYGAGWMGAHTLFARDVLKLCTREVRGVLDVFPVMFTCGVQKTFSAGLLWFLLLMAIGIAMMLILRRPDERKF